MAERTLHSGTVQFIDTTDTQKIDVHIASSLPTIQTYSTSDKEYSPDWTKTNLTLTAIVYADATNVTDIVGTEYSWYVARDSETSWQIINNKTNILKIQTNELENASTIRYKCEVTYNKKSFSNEISFAKVQSGTPGADGSSAPEVKAQYSVDGTSSWTATLDSLTHKYIRFSYDDGATWTAAIKIAGEDGTSVQIKSVAYTRDTLSKGNTVILYSDEALTTQITGGSTGDSYLVDGYLCVYNEDTQEFICTDKIQGPQGQKGDSYYLFIRYADNANGSGMSTSSTGKKYIGFYRSSVNQVPTDSSAVTWNWAKFVGEDAKSVILSASSQVFKTDKSNIITPAIITVTAQAVNTIINSWIYSVDGGRTFSDTAPTGVTRNGNVFTLTGNSISNNSIVIKVSDGTYSDILTVYKVSDGVDGNPGDDGTPASIAFLTNENITFAANANGQVTGTTVYCNVVAYNGITKVTPTIGIITGMPTGMTLGEITTVANEQVIPITIANNATLGSAQNINGSLSIPIISPVATNLKLNWSKVNSGANGSSASLVNITPSALYFKSTNGKDGQFTPDYIFLYPKFQNVSYRSWQYSTDGGVTWTATTGVNGLSVVTREGIGNILRVSKDSTIYTDEVTSVSFRCNSSDETIYDVVSITKIYDIVDLKIGGRNLARFTSSEHWGQYSTAYVGFSEGTRSKRIKATCTATDTSTSAVFGIRQDAEARLMKLQSGQEYTLSFLVRGNVTNLNYTYLMNPGSTNMHIGGLDLPTISETNFTRVVRTFTPTTTVDTSTGSYLMFSSSGAKDTTKWFELEEIQLEVGNVATDWTPAPEDMLNEAANVNVMLSNEAHFFEADSNGVPTATSIVLDVIGFKGSIQSTTTVGTISGIPSTGMGVTTSNNGTTNTKITISVTTNLTSAIADYGALTIPITVNGHTVNKVFSWSKAKAGVAASLVDITPTAYYFKSTTGKDGTFTPEYIYIYPRFQNVSYSNWQYSIDGGTTWTSVSGANGLTVNTYNTAPNSLRVSRSSTLYTDNVTSISFRCNSNNASVYDTVSIAKIYDVVDIDIGGRNLLRNSTFNEDSNWNRGTNIGQIISAESDKPNSRIYHVQHTNTSTTTATGNAIFNTQRNFVTLKAGESIAVSFDFYADDFEKVGSIISTLRISTASTGGTVTSLVNFNKAQIINTAIAGKWNRVSYVYTTPIDREGWLMFGLYIRAEIGASVDYKYREVKVEHGNKPTDWTPAPEDVDTKIETIDTKITNVSTEMKTSLADITSRVSATETTISTINGNVSNLTTRVSTAEEKITDNAIVSTVRQSTDYTNDLGQKVSSNEIISKINQTAENITISANKIGLLGATNIPDLTADKIKGGTLTLGGSNATTQDGQLLVKNTSDTDVVKLNKDGVMVKSGHLAVAEDFTNSTYNWEDGSWSTTTNTSQLDLGDDYLRMGIYSPSGYTNYMRLLNDGLYFQGNAQGIGSWGSYIGHYYYDMSFTIQDTVSSNITFRGVNDVELANISSGGFSINGPVSGGITSGNAKQFSNVFTQNFSSQQTGYIAIRLGTITRAVNSMITIKGHITSYHNSTSFEASCYFYSANSAFYGTVATMSNPDVLKEVYFAEGVSDGCVYLILGSSNSAWSYPTVAVDTLTVGFSGSTAYEWNSGWIADVYANLNNFKTVTSCSRGGMKTTLWSGAVNNGKTITLAENLRNFKFLTCIIGDSTTPYGIVLTSLLDDEIAELHFFAFTTNPYADSQAFGAKFTINNQTSLTLVACGTKENSTLYCRKIVGWR